MDYLPDPKFLTRAYVRPPAIKAEEVSLFADTLPDTVRLKLIELISRIQELEILAVPPVLDSPDPFVNWLRDFIFETSDERLELLAAKDWLKYWLRIDRLLKPKVPDSDEVTERDIEIAKLVPLSDVCGVQLRRTGNKLVGLCPFHQEKTPSFTVFANNTWYCFGCHLGGDVIEFVQRIEGKDFINAVKSLRR